MANISQKEGLRNLSLDTLAQVPPNSLKTLKNRARSKWYTTGIVSRLKYIEDTPLKKYYSHAWNCCQKIYQDGKKLTSRYCNTRVCHICSRIRTAKLMNGYVDQIMKLEHIEFVTLTIPNCKGEELSSIVDHILQQIVLIIRNLREKKGIKVSGIRKVEITYNAIRDDFHPHLHLLVDKNVGNQIVDQWLNRMPTAKRKAQDVREADKNSLSEIFKYTTKIIARKKGKMDVYVRPLDVILKSLYRRRCFQAFGIVKMISEDVDELDGVVYDELEDTNGGILEWVWKECDWVFGKKTLTGYVPPEIEINYLE